MRNSQTWATPQLSQHGSVASVTGVGDFDEANCPEGVKGPGRADSCSIADIEGLTGSPLG